MNKEDEEYQRESRSLETQYPRQQEQSNQEEEHDSTHEKPFEASRPSKHLMNPFKQRTATAKIFAENPGEARQRSKSTTSSNAKVDETGTGEVVIRRQAWEIEARPERKLSVLTTGPELIPSGFDRLRARFSPNKTSVQRLQRHQRQTPNDEKPMNSVVTALVAPKPNSSGLVIPYQPLGT